ncbi:alpha/beta hydrolase [Bradyrhizobium sp. U87765 SZCCT0131]|uniref:alpha/beta hydrolase n=1 Tax=unclassified Bradyrhizobium TaxID=2631580 RepID=UPI001BAE3DD0|nr:MULTISPECIES: alpha/beta hydrolase [unclassified Bradyrhizobium]MBR1218284.1 alpha/beta hydrolase [Bradyrhizobium sp. U87765 SZCCT0131]MBR1260770.1 alpha/beta hydrolase [Bradyrhizobium sp. U87765 SZCCT0134]MBR1303782.1 alpha/beta hydrolase [Bradyrhizobium sp. U87765 SZCCT0110]MBR1319388.1 alpha/beta hydrolase [Bradyrhizobium sp. U87765 SZCCT0109]MBR1347713.1 alpha/beta hydrolase [Bradyrhizobium sp. U87765 SZCCT0048]
MTTQCKDTAIETGTGDLPVRVYRDSALPRSAPLVFHLHGGAFCSGTLQTCDIVPELLAEAGAVVVSADYPLAPGHRFPDALRALFGGLRTLRRTRAHWAGRLSRLLVAGEEAGGNLAASLALMARDQRGPELAGQILLSPMLDPCLGTTSIRSADVGPAGCKWSDGWQNYLGSPDKAAHPYAAPSQSSRLVGLPSTLMVTAQDDPMRDESLSYAGRLRKSGVAVREHVLSAPTAWPGSLCGDVAAPRDWTADLRGQFKQFFADIAATPRRSASHQLVEV